ncbi:hypothetical protein D3C72_2080790 [compost metagenome]
MSVLIFSRKAATSNEAMFEMSTILLPISRVNSSSVISSVKGSSTPLIFSLSIMKEMRPRK